MCIVWPALFLGILVSSPQTFRVFMQTMTRQLSVQPHFEWDLVWGGYPFNKSCCKANKLCSPVEGAADSSKWKCLSERNGFEVRRDLGSEGEEGEARLLGWLWQLWLAEEILLCSLFRHLLQIIPGNTSLKMEMEALSLGRFFCTDLDFQFPGWHVTLTCLKPRRLLDVWGPWWSWFTRWQITVMTSVAVPSRLPSWLPAPWTRPSACTPSVTSRSYHTPRWSSTPMRSTAAVSRPRDTFWHHVRQTGPRCCGVRTAGSPWQWWSSPVAALYVFAASPRTPHTWHPEPLMDLLFCGMHSHTNCIGMAVSTLPGLTPVKIKFYFLLW